MKSRGGYVMLEWLYDEIKRLIHDFEVVVMKSRDGYVMSEWLCDESRGGYVMLK